MTRRSVSVAGQAGLTLLELMVSLGLGLVLLVGVATVYLGSRQAYQLQEGSGRLQETGRYALEMIGRSLRQAGAAAPMLSDQVQAVKPPDCKPGDQAACTAASGVDGAGNLPDTLIVQYYANNDEEFPVGSGNLGTRDCTDGFVSVGAPATGTLVTNVYSLVGTNLTCTGSVGGTAALLSDIEDFQVLYGVDTDGGIGTTDAYPSANLYAATPADWGRVVSVRVCVLVRSQGLGMTATRGQRYLNCAGALGVATCQNVSPPCAAGTAAFSAAAVTDTRLRRPFVATFTMRSLVGVPPRMTQ